MNKNDDRYNTLLELAQSPPQFPERKGDCVLQRVANATGDRQSLLCNVAVKHIPGATRSWAAGVMDGWDARPTAEAPQWSSYPEYQPWSSEEYLQGMVDGDKARKEILGA